MNIEKDRFLFIDWHFNKYYARDADKEFLYEMFEGKNEFISYEVQHSWIAWQASANREGYKLVPVEPSKETLLLMCDEIADCKDINEMCCAYKAMIGACDDTA